MRIGRQGKYGRWSQANNMMGRCFKERSFYRIEHNNPLDNPDQRRLDLDDAIVSSFFRKPKRSSRLSIESFSAERRGHARWKTIQNPPDMSKMGKISG